MHSGRVLVIDLDPQRSAFDWGVERGEQTPDVMVGTAATLQTDIDEARADEYDLVFIDTPPLAEREAAKAAAVADLVILPIRPSKIDLLSLRVSVEMLRKLGKTGVGVVTQAPIARNSSVVKETMAEIVGMGLEVSSAIIRGRVAFQHSRIDGRVAAEYEPGGAAAGEVALLLNDIITRLRVISSPRTPVVKPTRKLVASKT